MKTISVLTAIATILSLSGLMYFFANYAGAVAPSDYSLKEGDTVSATGSDDPDVYIVNDAGYKRLFLNPAIFSLYGHLGGFASVKSVSPATRDAFVTSGLFRVDGDEKVYGLETTGEDTAVLRWVNTTGAQAVTDDPNFFKKVFVINAAEKALYSTGTDFTSVSQVPAYTRGGSVAVTPTPVAGPISVALAPGNPASRTITVNATGVEFLRVNFSGTGTVNTMTLKRLGAGETDDFGNVYVYDGAKRLTSGKSFSSSSGELTFLVNVAVSGSKELSIVSDMASTNTAANINYLQLLGATATGSVTVSGTPLNGNNFTTAGANSGTITVAKSGSLSDVTVGQKQGLLSEFKYTASTEGGTVKRITMINGGTLKPVDLTNLKIKVEADGKEWSGVSTTDSYAVFDLGAGHFIAKGGNSIFKVYGDVMGKKDETVILYFENDADTFVVGDQYGQGMAVTDTALDASGDATTVTLKGGALTLVFDGPTATTVGTTVSDATFLKYTVTAASNIEIRRTEVTLCVDTTGDGTFDAAIDETEWDELNDVKIWNVDLNTVVMGPRDGTAFTDANGGGSSGNANDSGSCPDSATGAQTRFTDTVDLMAGKTYNFKITADVDTSLGGTLTASGSIIRIVLDDYSDDAGDVAVAKYSGTNTSVAAADIVPRADIAGPNITVSASSLTLSLAGNPADQTKIRGTKDVNMVGVIFAASQASALKVTTIKVTGYAAESPTGVLFDEGVATDDGGSDSGISVANAMATVQLYEAESGSVIASSDKVSSNILGTSGTGTMTFSNLAWNIPAGTSKTMLVRVNLANNTASGTAGDGYAFDIAGTADVTALDSDSKTINAGNQKVNGTAAAPTQILTVKNGGTMTAAVHSDTPQKAGIYWGQLNAPVSKFRLTATDEGQYIERLTFAASNSTEATNAAANVGMIHLTYKNKAGSTLTTSQSFGNAASINFAWSSGDANRPYVPQDSSLDLSVNADMKTKAQGATQTGGTSTIYFSIDFMDKFDGSHTNGFRAVGDGSGTVLSGTATGINDVTTANDQYVYRVYPKIAQLSLSSPYDLIGNPNVFKFTVTAQGLSDSTLRFDNEAVGSGSIKFEVVSSGAYTVGGATQSTTFTIYDEGSVTIDTGSITAGDARTGTNASITFDFSSKDVEIAGGGTKTFTIQIDNPTTNYPRNGGASSTDDYFQVVLRDDEAGLVNWVGNYDQTTAAGDTASTTGTIKSLPLFGPTFK
ncbi:MAG: Uncharacterized protein G01um101444_144 [Parcubacteria group bacterium Gr01-1014_44]|nr:MAG: Uncharacterized protein G01um101444_144 [Parcubacteria group bacterium Gr01-1014_44]